MQGQFNPMTGQMGETWPILSQIQQLFTVRTLTTDIDHIDKDVDVLMVVHPKRLAPKTLYAIDQFVMRGGKLLLFVDPDSGADTSGQDPQNPFAGATANHSSDFEPLLAAWGVSYDPSKVIGDLELGLEVRASQQGPPTRHIGILGLHAANMDRKDVDTASLDSINVATAGFLTARAGATTKFEPLLIELRERGAVAGHAIQRDDRSRRACATDSNRRASATRLRRESRGPCPPHFRRGRRRIRSRPPVRRSRISPSPKHRRIS